MAATDNGARQGTIINLQRYSVHDGPGIRTMVFFKGCPLACRWCANPESQRPGPEPGYNPATCLGSQGCARCVRACPHGAVSPRGPRVELRRESCAACPTCACSEVCPTGSFVFYGYTASVNEILDVVEKEDVFYTRSGGGLTLSGGEPLAQPEFAAALLAEAKRRRLNTALETSGAVDWHILREAVRCLDTVLYDIKHADGATHKQGTGAGNDRIVDNFRKLAASFPDKTLMVRTPVIPGFNDNPQALGAIADLLEPFDVSWELLPYHRLGSGKYARLGRTNPMGNAVLSAAAFAALQKDAALRLGSRLHCGGGNCPAGK